MKKIEIRGQNLHIDDAIHGICVVANSTSSNTRSVLYLLVLVNIISFIAFLNTNHLTGTWSSARFVKNFGDLYDTLKIHASSGEKGDSIRSQLIVSLQNKNFESSIKAIHENVEAVKVPAIGNTFDINDLGAVCGLSVTTLLIIISFTLNRERANLRIALKAITERYTSNSDRLLFKDSISELKATGEDSEVEILDAINETRRQHHYNHLTMNEVFNGPPLDTETEGNKKTIFALADYIFWFPIIVYTLICVNDLASFNEIYPLSPQLTTQLLASEMIFWIVILVLIVKCTNIKKSIVDHYIKFRNNKYNYV
jgi:hypothetical protein